MFKMLLENQIFVANSLDQNLNKKRLKPKIKKSGDVLCL